MRIEGEVRSDAREKGEVEEREGEKDIGGREVVRGRREGEKMWKREGRGEEVRW